MGTGKSKGKGKVPRLNHEDILCLIKHHTMITYGCIALCILNLAIRWRRMVSLTPQKLYPEV